MFSIYSDGLILNDYEHYRVYEFAKNHINGVESFWSFAKRRLAKFNGLKNFIFIRVNFGGITKIQICIKFC